MATVLLRLNGPCQSWGEHSRFEIRDSRLAPTKSGVIGLVAAALGRDRMEPIADLAALKMGVRVLNGGVLMSDFQTARRVARFDSRPPQTMVLHKHFLAGADFLVALEGDDSLIRMIDAALHIPRYPLSLGRAAYIPALPVWVPDGVRNEGMRDALLHWSWEDEATQALCYYEDEQGTERWHDQPISFVPGQSQYVTRQVRRVREPRPAEVA